MPGMADVHRGRHRAEIDGDFVVFLIGMRVNRVRAVRSWLPVFVAMPRMLLELDRHPELGLLHRSTAITGPRSIHVTQYWRSFAQLEAYARSPEVRHLPAWTAFNRAAQASGGATGIWHETYRVAAGEHETIYVDLPPVGLGAAGRLTPVGSASRARDRLGAEPGAEQPVS